MSRNSIEKRSRMLEKSYFNRSRCNPESSTSIIISPLTPTRQQRPIQDSISLNDNQFNKDTLETRYLALQQMYKDLLIKVRQKNPNSHDQSTQIQKLKIKHQKNQKQIRMLRGMLGFLDKHDKSAQTEQPQPNSMKFMENNISSIKSCDYLHKIISNNSTKDSVFISKYQKDLQTQQKINNGLNNISKNSTRKNIDLCRGESVRGSRSSKNLINQIKPQQNVINSQSKRAQRCVSPGGLKDRYKFVPSLPIY